MVVGTVNVPYTPFSNQICTICMEFGKNATNFDSPHAEIRIIPERPPKLPALFPNCMHCRLNWPEKAVYTMLALHCICPRPPTLCFDPWPSPYWCKNIWLSNSRNSRFPKSADESCNLIGCRYAAPACQLRPVYARGRCGQQATSGSRQARVSAVVQCFLILMRCNGVRDIYASGEKW